MKGNCGSLHFGRDDSAFMIGAFMAALGRFTQFLAVIATAVLVACIAPCAHAQWQMQASNTTADLRGIANVGNGVAWASGTSGTVLRTEDGGYVWQTCAIPPGAEKLDFRGIQAFDANTAIVMSSGKGDQSRLYKTTDGCHTWKLIFTNPDPDGFWDGIKIDWVNSVGLIVGDPVQGHFAIFTSRGTALEQWLPFDRSWLQGILKVPSPQYDTEGLFAASNSIIWSRLVFDVLVFATGGQGGSYIYRPSFEVWPPPTKSSGRFFVRKIPVAKGAAAGTFSFAADLHCIWLSRANCPWIAVGGDYTKPDIAIATAAYSKDGGYRWTASQTPPHGYRSSVAYDEKTKTWITVGPNGTDISTDDGRNWRAVHPSPALHEAPDADRNWNAISLPYVVGPKGRIGKLDEAAIK